MYHFVSDTNYPISESVLSIKIHVCLSSFGVHKLNTHAHMHARTHTPTHMRTHTAPNFWMPYSTIN